jgi:hypothetical protein
MLQLRLSLFLRRIIGTAIMIQSWERLPASVMSSRWDIYQLWFSPRESPSAKLSGKWTRASLTRNPKIRKATSESATFHSFCTWLVSGRKDRSPPIPLCRCARTRLVFLAFTIIAVRRSTTHELLHFIPVNRWCLFCDEVRQCHRTGSEPADLRCRKPME